MLPDAYGCAVANRFGNLLDDDADPFDLLSEAEKVKERKRKEEEKKAKLKKAGQKESQKERRLPRSTFCPDPLPARKQPQACPVPGLNVRNGTQAIQRGAKRATFGERKAKQEEQPQDFSIPKPSYSADSDLRGRGDASGRRVGPARFLDNMNIRAKREYDRRNGLGVSPEEKRGGRGAWNWGCVEAASELMEVTSDPVKSEEPQVSMEKENQNRAVEEDGDMVVQFAMGMSLDEWKALQEMSRPKAEFNIRKAENKIPSKAKVIHQSRHPEKLGGTMDDLDDCGIFRKSMNDITSMLDINFGSLDRPRRGGRGRGTPVVPGGRPERARPMLDKEEPLAPNPDNPEEFPALPTGR